MPSSKLPSVHSLKSQAKKIATEEKIPLSQALDRMANRIGFSHWALLQKNFAKLCMQNIASIWQGLAPGELLLLSAGENVGKLSMALNIAHKALIEQYPLHYCSQHMNRQSIVERLSLIANRDWVEMCLNKRCLVIEDEVIDETVFLKAVDLLLPGTVLVIDYLQAIASEDNHQCFLRALRRSAKEKELKVIVLSQVLENKSSLDLSYLDGGANITRHFSHVLHLECVTEEGVVDHREMALLKSTHYRKQKSLLQFNRQNFRFS